MYVCSKSIDVSSRVALVKQTHLSLRPLLFVHTVAPRVVALDTRLPPRRGQKVLVHKLVDLRHERVDDRLPASTTGQTHVTLGAGGSTDAQIRLGEKLEIVADLDRTLFQLCNEVK
jgi:hypothetical protein